MANLKLKKIILEVVNNQLRDQEPPAAQEAYQALLEAGYSVSEAKEKIGAVVLEEIYDVMKENKPHDAERYAAALNKMVQECTGDRKAHKIQTEWNKWDNFVQKGYEANAREDFQTMITSWWNAWEIFQKIVKKAEFKISIGGIMESQDYRYPVDAWLQDFEMELGNHREHEKRMEFCQKVLEMMDWTIEDNSNFVAAIGEELYRTERADEGRKWFEDWLKKEPNNANLLSAFSWCIEEREGTEQAYQLIRRKVIGTACTFYNVFLFERAHMLAQCMELEKDLDWIETQLKSFYESMEKAEEYNDFYDDFLMPVQQPIVKAEKIYPNDPCPCGSGKKYKKCCGRK